MKFPGLEQKLEALESEIGSSNMLHKDWWLATDGAICGAYEFVSLNGISLGGLVREAHTAELDLVRQAHTAVWDLTVWYCLSEEEVALAGPDSGITDDEYAGMICTVEAFGGLEGLADAYKTTDPEEFADGLLINASGC